jgi:hypothetical protein
MSEIDVARLEKEWRCNLNLRQRAFVLDLIKLDSFNGFSSVGSGKTFVLEFIEELMRRNKNYKPMENPFLLQSERRS